MPRELVDVLEPAHEAAIDVGELLGGGRRVGAENLIRRLTTTALYTRVAITDLHDVLARCHPRMHARRRPARQ